MTSFEVISAKYNIGDDVPVKVIEHIEGDEWIVSFEGHLLKVINNSKIKMEEGQLLYLQLTQLHPPQLTIEE